MSIVHSEEHYATAPGSFYIYNRWMKSLENRAPEQDLKIAQNKLPTY